MNEVMHNILDKMKSYIYIYIYIGVAVALLTLVANFNFVSAANPEDVDFVVNVAPSLNVEVPTGNSIVFNLNPNTKTFDYRDIDVVVSTNNLTGYKLSMSTSDGTTNLVRDTSTDGVSGAISTLAANASGYSDSDFENCPETNLNCINKWGFKVISSDTNPEKVTANYYPFADDAALAVNHTTTNGDTTSLRFATKIGWAQMAGTYENTLVFTAVATYAAYHIDYYDGVNNTTTIATQDNAYNTQAIVPINPVYSGGYTAPHRTGLSANTYTFIGWCDVIPGGETTDGYFAATTCPTGHDHAPGSTITIDPTEYSTNLKLYAYWDPTTFAEAYQAAGAIAQITATPTSGSARTAYIMQNMTPAICAAVTAGETEFLGDNRSGTYGYYVGKLKDDKCWMTQNLRLGMNASSVTLTNANSNISASSWTLNGKVAAPGKFTTYTACATGTCEDRYTSTTYYNDNNAFYCTPVSGDTTQYVGCYYNWYSATASSGTSSITPVGTSTGYKDVSSSICPKGWFLPTGGGVPLSGSTSDRPNSDFNVLYNNYPSAAQMLVPNPTTTYDNPSGASLPGLFLSGRYYSGGANNVAQNGYYWSRSAYSKGIAYNLNLISSAVYPQYYHRKYYGLSVRCVAYGS